MGLTSPLVPRECNKQQLLRTCFTYKMTQKRKQAEGPIYNSKRPRSLSIEGNEELSGALQPRVDPTYGQRGAFPGLDEWNQSSLFYGPANDGLEYLRMVR